MTKRASRSELTQNQAKGIKKMVARIRREADVLGTSLKPRCGNERGMLTAIRNKFHVEKVASTVPNVLQVVNELQIKGQKTSSTPTQ